MTETIFTDRFALITPTVRPDSGPTAATHSHPRTRGRGRPPEPIVA